MTHDDVTPARDLSAGLNTADLRTLARIHQHPLTHSLALRDVTALFSSIGKAESQHNGELRLSIGDDALTLTRPHGKDMTSDEVVMIRHFLDRAGGSPSEPVAAPLNTPAADMVLIIDHAGARVHRLSGADATHHLLHHIDRKQHDADRAETYPDDQRFFADIARVLAPAGQIVVIGHGKGQSNEAHHLIAWLDGHHPEIHARIARQISADLPHLTQGELISMARHALAKPTDQTPMKGTVS